MILPPVLLHIQQNALFLRLGNGAHRREIPYTVGAEVDEISPQILNLHSLPTDPNPVSLIVRDILDLHPFHLRRGNAVHPDTARLDLSRLAVGLLKDSYHRQIFSLDASPDLPVSHIHAVIRLSVPVFAVIVQFPLNAQPLYPEFTLTSRLAPKLNLHHIPQLEAFTLDLRL